MTELETDKIGIILGEKLPKRDVQKMLSDIQRHDADQDYFFKNIKKFKRKYGDKHIAIRNKKIIAVSSTKKGLISALKKENLAIGDCFTEYLGDQLSLLW